ncbi:MAG: 4'-phosphopantetheinyl transferase superfamily protein [Desulfobacterales bacterium]|jgi:4'-phosphopantetheinyl transferase
MSRQKTFRIPHSAFRTRTIFPVILSVPEKVADYKPRDRVTFLSQHARKAIAASAQKSGISPGELKKDENGAPLPFEGTYWSITHKSEYVAGVVSPRPIGIDIEKILPCSRGLYKRTATQSEWSLADQSQDDFSIFYRYWTAKEAVLKASTTGIKDLLKCRIEQIIDEHHLAINYLNKKWFIEHHFFNDHIASIVQNDARIVWTII